MATGLLQCVLQVAAAGSLLHAKVRRWVETAPSIIHFSITESWKTPAQDLSSYDRVINSTHVHQSPSGRQPWLDLHVCLNCCCVPRVSLSQAPWWVTQTFSKRCLDNPLWLRDNRYYCWCGRDCCLRCRRSPWLMQHGAWRTQCSDQGFFHLLSANKMLWHEWNELLARWQYASHPLLLFILVRLAGSARLQMGLSEYIQGIQQASVVIVRDTENWFLLMQRISCSTLNFLEIVKILTVSLRMSPDTLRRRLISVASIWDLILSVTCQKPVTRGWRLECKCRGKGRALPSGCAPSSPQHSGTTKHPPQKRLAARQLRHYNNTAASSSATWCTAAGKAVFVLNHQKRSRRKMANQHK